MKKNVYRVYPGTSIAEYGLIAAAIAVVCIGAVIFLGQDVGEALGLLKSDMQKRQASAQAARYQAAEEMNAQMDAQAVAPSGALGTPGDWMPPESLILGNSMASNIETSGANGNTEMLASQMEQMASELLAQGKITQTQANEITKLANEGYRQASIQALLEDGMAKAKSPQEYANMRITFEGKSYSTTELGYLLGWPQDHRGPTETHGLLSTQYAGAANADFIRQYQKVLASGAANDPTVRGMIDNMSSQITLGGELLAGVSYNVVNQNEPVPSTSQLNKKVANYAAGYPEDLPGQSVVSSVTTGSASNICKVGKGKANGKKCT